MLKNGFSHFHSIFLPNLSLNSNSLFFSYLLQIESGVSFLGLWICVFRVGTQQQQMGGGEGYKYPSPNRWVIKFRKNLRRLRTQKLAVKFKKGLETPQKCPETSDKPSIFLFLEIFGISAKMSEIFGISGIFFRVSTGPPRQNAITFYSGLRIR